MTDLGTPQARDTSAEPSPPFFGVPYGAYRDERSVSLRDGARLLYAERRLVAAVMLAALLVSIVGAFTATPVYRAEVLLAPVVQNKNDGLSTLMGQLGDLAAIMDGLVANTKDRTAESIATLRSRSLAIDFIRAQNLKPRLFPDRWDHAQQRWRDGVRVPTDLEAYDVFDSRVRAVTVERRSGMVSLAIEWTDPVLAAAWANSLAAAANERRRSEEIHEAQQTIKYLQQQLAHNSSVEIQQSIYRLIEAQTKTIALAAAREEYAFRVIDPAVAAESPVRPRRSVMLAAGLAVGAVLAVALALLRAAIRRERSQST
jgi:uncharacterized protein involved in exopolysaccharide biosynthesis